jgi:hypothetical protein
VSDEPRPEDVVIDLEVQSSSHGVSDSQDADEEDEQ